MDRIIDACGAGRGAPADVRRNPIADRLPRGAALACGHDRPVDGRGCSGGSVFDYVVGSRSLESKLKYEVLQLLQPIASA